MLRIASILAVIVIGLIAAPAAAARPPEWRGRTGRQFDRRRRLAECLQ